MIVKIYDVEKDEIIKEEQGEYKSLPPVGDVLIDGKIYSVVSVIVEYHVKENKNWLEEESNK